MASPTPVPSRWSELPNWLTCARFVMALGLFAFLALHWWPLCLPLFLLAAGTDWLDGYLARRYGWTSDFGRNMDPLADKVLVCGAFIFLLDPGLAEGWLMPWMVAVVVLREMAITALRTYMEGRGVKFGADWLGKLKMWLQCAALIAVLTWLILGSGSEANAWLGMICKGLIWAMTGATVLSGLQYLWKAYQMTSRSPSVPT